MEMYPIHNWVPRYEVIWGGELSSQLLAPAALFRERGPSTPWIGASEPYGRGGEEKTPSAENRTPVVHSVA